MTRLLVPGPLEGDKKVCWPWRAAIQRSGTTYSSRIKYQLLCGSLVLAHEPRFLVLTWPFLYMFFKAFEAISWHRPDPDKRPSSMNGPWIWHTRMVKFVKWWVTRSISKVLSHEKRKIDYVQSKKQHSFAQGTFKVFHLTKGTAPLKRNRQEQPWFTTSRACVAQDLLSGGAICYFQGYTMFPAARAGACWFLSVVELLRIWNNSKTFDDKIQASRDPTGFDSFGQQNTSSIDSRETNTGNLGFSGGSSECSQPSQGTIQCIRCCHAYIASRTQALRPFLFRLFYIVEPRVFR